MGLPPEDLPPAWIRDYDTLYDIGGSSGTGAGSGPGVRVDMPSMEEFAAALRSNLQKDYLPHRQKVNEDMTTPVRHDGAFVELQSALTRHRDVQVAATDNLTNHGNGAFHFATSAKEISDLYGSTDAYAAARVSDVNDTLGVNPDGSTTTNPTNPSPATPPDGRP